MCGGIPNDGHWRKTAICVGLCIGIQYRFGWRIMAKSGQRSGIQYRQTILIAGFAIGLEGFKPALQPRAIGPAQIVKASRCQFRGDARGGKGAGLLRRPPTPAIRSRKNETRRFLAQRCLLEKLDTLPFEIYCPRNPGLGFAQPNGLRLPVKIPYLQTRQFGIPRAGQQGSLQQGAYSRVAGIDEAARFIIGYANSRRRPLAHRRTSSGKRLIPSCCPRSARAIRPPPRPAMRAYRRSIRRTASRSTRWSPPRKRAMTTSWQTAIPPC